MIVVDKELTPLLYSIKNKVVKIARQFYYPPEDALQELAIIEWFKKPETKSYLISSLYNLIFKQKNWVQLDENNLLIVDMQQLFAKLYVQELMEILCYLDKECFRIVKVFVEEHCSNWMEVYRLVGRNRSIAGFYRKVEMVKRVALSLRG